MSDYTEEDVERVARAIMRADNDGNPRFDLEQWIKSEAKRRYGAHARAALSSIPRQNVPEWMPIAKAAVNKRGLVWVADQLMTNNPICFGGVRECRVDIGFEKHRYAWAEGLNGDWNITHWSPLPAPPSQQGER